MATKSHTITLAEAWELEAAHGVTLGRPTGADATKNTSYRVATPEGYSARVREDAASVKKSAR